MPETVWKLITHVPVAGNKKKERKKKKATFAVILMATDVQLRKRDFSDNPYLHINLLTPTVTA